MHRRMRHSRRISREEGFLYASYSTMHAHMLYVQRDWMRLRPRHPQRFDALQDTLVQRHNEHSIIPTSCNTPIDRFLLSLVSDRKERVLHECANDTNLQARLR